MRTIITRLLTCIVVLLCIPTSASAFDFEVEGIYYTILSDSESTCEVSKGYGEYTGDVEIPSAVTFEARQYLVTKIASNAFVGCSSITSVTLPNSVSESLFGVFTGCSSLAEISVAQDNPNYSSIDGVLFNKDCTELIAYPNAKGSEYTIPDSVMFIGIEAFAYCNDLTSVTISDSVTVIAMNAFNRCSYLTNVKFGNSVISIRDAAFAYCYSLTSVTLPNSLRLIER